MSSVAYCGILGYSNCIKNCKNALVPDIYWDSDIGGTVVASKDAMQPDDEYFMSYLLLHHVI